MAHISLRLLGPFHLELGNKPASGFRSDKVRALLAYLAVEAHRPWARATLADLLWPNFPEKTAQSNLRNALSNLRRVLGDQEAPSPLLRLDQSTVQFNRSADCWLDVRAFLELLDTAGRDEKRPLNETKVDQLAEALALYRGEFLEGFALDSAPFETWLRASRAELRQQAGRAARRLAMARKVAGDLPAAAAFAQRWLDLEPWEEAAHRLMMEILARRGERSAALAQLDICRRQLDQELGVEPSAETVRLYEEIKNDRFAPTTGATPPTWPGLIPQPLAEPVLFLAREAELEKLNAALERAVRAQGSVYFVTGEPGSGKTTLLAEFARRDLAHYPDLLVAWGQCSAFTGQGDPYFPFLHIVRTLVGETEAQIAPGESSSRLAQRLWQGLPAAVDAVLDHAPDLVNRFISGPSLLAFAQQHSGVDPDRLSRLEELVSQAAAQPPQKRLPQTALFAQFTYFLSALAERRPLLLIVDDMQWIDPGSINLLFHLTRQLAGSHILLLGAYRPEAIALQQESRPHSFLDLVSELRSSYGDLQLELTESDGMAFVAALLDSEPNQLDREFYATLYRHTSGNPLFTIELLRGMQQRGEIRPNLQGQWVEGPHLNWHKLPARVEAVIARRIGHVSAACRETLDVACVEGEQFTAEVVAGVLEQDTPPVRALLSQEAGRQHRLVTAQVVRPVAGRNLAVYRFRHGLFQIYLYNHLDVVEKAHLHGRIATQLEQTYGQSLAQFPEMAHALARHFAAAGMAGKAVVYFTLAGKRALHLSANREAIAHFYSALNLLDTLPATPERDRQELDLRLNLGPALTAAKGWAPPEMVAAYARVQELCANLDDSAQLIPALFLLATFRIGRSEHEEVDKLVARLFRLAQQAGDPNLLALARLQVSPFYQGKLALARQLLEAVAAAPDVAQQRFLAQQFGLAPAVVALAYLGECLWLLGFPAEADQHSREARELAEQVQHPMASCYALGRSCWLAAEKGDVAGMEKLAPVWREVAQRYGLDVFALGARFFEHWAAAHRGPPPAEDIEQMQQLMEAYRATGTMLNHTAFLVFFAEACGRAGQLARGLAAVEESLSLGEQTGERWFEPAAWHMKGELLARQAGDGAAPETMPDAVACFQMARQVAEQHGARAIPLAELKIPETGDLRPSP